MGLSLSFVQVAQLLESVHEIAPKQSDKFRWRLRNLQRLGVPQGRESAQGKAAKYSLDHLLQLAFAVELLDLGLSPERAKFVLGSWWFLRMKIAERAAGRDRLFVELVPAALNDLRDPRSSLRALQTAIVPVKTDKLLDRLRSGFERPIAIIDVFAFVLRVTDQLQLTFEVPDLESDMELWMQESTDAMHT